MERINVGRVLLAGFVATLAMTMLIYVAPMMGMPKMDIAGMLGSMLNGGHPPEAMSGPWMMGMLAHLLNGIVIFPLIYAYGLSARLPGAAWTKGLIWGTVLWLVQQGMVLPMMGLGFFSSQSPHAVMSVLGSLMGHLLYGAILGAMIGTQDTARSAFATSK